MSKGKDGGGKVKMDTAFDKSSKGTPGNSPTTLKGSVGDLSHSISGASRPTGRTKGGKTDKFD